MKPLLYAAAAVTVVVIVSAWFLMSPTNEPLPIPVLNQEPGKQSAVTADKLTATDSRGTKLTASAQFHGLMRTRTIGDYRAGHEEHWDFCPAGSVVVGFEVSTREEDGKGTIASLRPIFRSASGDTRGILNGIPVSSPNTIVAKPGYAVGAMDGCGAHELEGFRLIFLRLFGDKLDATDSYRSEWIGGGERAAGSALDTETKVAVGVGMRCGARIHSLTLFTRNDEAGQGSADNPAKPMSEPLLLASAGAEDGVVFVRGDNHYQLFLNGVLVLLGNDWRTFHARRLSLARGDVLASVVRDDESGTTGGFTLQVMRNNVPILETGQLRYSAFPHEDWKTNPDVSDWHAPQMTEVSIGTGSESKSKTAWAPAGGAASPTLYFKVVVP